MAEERRILSKQYGSCAGRRHEVRAVPYLPDLLKCLLLYLAGGHSGCYHSGCDRDPEKKKGNG